MNLSTLPTDATGQLDVLGHDGHPLGVDGAQVGVLKQTNQVSLAGLLKSHDSRALEAQIGLEVLGNFPDQTLERQLADQQLSGLLVATDLSQSHCAGPVTMRFLHSSGRWCAFASSLGGELLSRSLSSGGFTGGLLSSCHCKVCFSERSAPEQASTVFKGYNLDQPPDDVYLLVAADWCSTPCFRWRLKFKVQSPSLTLRAFLRLFIYRNSFST